MATVLDPSRNATVVALIAAALVLACGSAAAVEWESPEHNVILRIPGEPAPWAWVTTDPRWAAHGVIRCAERRLEKRLDGKPPDGEGAILHLARRPAPADRTLAQVLEDETVRAFLLKRFGGSEREVKIEPTTVASGSNPRGHPALLLRARGQAPNLLGRQGACTGVMLVALARGHVHLLRMYAFPTAGDREDLEGDLASMEADDRGLELIDTTEPKPPPPPPDDEDGHDDPMPAGGEAVPLESRTQGWRLLRHVQLKQLDLTAEDRKNDVAWRFADSRASGGYSMWLQAVPDDKRVDGQKVAKPELRGWMTTGWWNDFTDAHSRGDIHTFEWPRKTATPTFLTLPRLEDPKAKVDVVTGQQKRPTDVDAHDMLRKLRCVQKPKPDTIGRRGATSEALRGILRGNRDREGIDTEARFAWWYRGHSYRLGVVLSGDAYERWGAAIRTTLESIEFDPKTR